MRLLTGFGRSWAWSSFSQNEDEDDYDEETYDHQPRHVTLQEWLISRTRGWSYCLDRRLYDRCRLSSDLYCGWTCGLCRHHRLSRWDGCLRWLNVEVNAQDIISRIRIICCANEPSEYVRSGGGRPIIACSDNPCRSDRTRMGDYSSSTTKTINLTLNVDRLWEGYIRTQRCKPHTEGH